VKLRPLRASLILSCLSFVGLLAYSLCHLLDHAAEAAYARDLRQLGATGTRLNEHLLISRSGLSAHYDDLVADMDELWRLQRAVSTLPRSVLQNQVLQNQVAQSPLPRAGQLQSGFSARLAATERVLEQLDQALERFKTQHAILRNSRHFLPVLARRVLSDSAGTSEASPLGSAVSRLLSALLVLDLKPSYGTDTSLSAELLELEASRPLAANAGVERDLELIISHARLIAERGRIVNDLLREILAVPFAEQIGQLGDEYAAHYRAALDRTTLCVRLLTLLAISSVVLGLTEVILRLDRGASALRQATAELESANRKLAGERERERELGELKTRFVSMTSHEFRTPLSTILSSSELLERYAERWDSAHRTSHLERIVNAARSMRHMLEEILLIGRAEAGALEPAPIRLDLARFCQELIDARQRGPEASHRIRISYRGPSEVCIDERLLSHILSNLLDNAVKYSGSDSEVTLAVLVTEGECSFAVRDAGIGIPVEEHSRLFGSFYRAGNVGRIPGSGLGLAVVKHAVEAQHGSIDLDSAPGKGSEFRIRLPLGSEQPGSVNARSA